MALHHKLTIYSIHSFFCRSFKLPNTKDLQSIKQGLSDHSNSGNESRRSISIEAKNRLLACTVLWQGVVNLKGIKKKEKEYYSNLILTITSLFKPFFVSAVWHLAAINFKIFVTKAILSWTRFLMTLFKKGKE